MGISYGGVPLLLEDPDGEIQDWICKWLPTADCRAISDWSFPIAAENFAGTSAACYTGQSLPSINYSRPQQIKLNVWYHPTGCSRWSFGFFLCDYARLQQIQSTVGSRSGALTLQSIATNGTTSTRTFAAYMLPCRAVSVNAFDPASLWIVPLVDERYFWQHYIGNVSPPIDGTSKTASTWSSFLTSLKGAFGFSNAVTFDVPPAAYLRPNYFILSGSGNYASSPQMTDAMLHSCGLRMVADYPAQSANTIFAGHQWKCINFSTSQTLLTQNRAHNYDLGFMQSGSGTLPGSLSPYRIDVNFRAWANGIVLPDWYQTRYQKSISVGGNPTAIKQFNSTALADYTSGGLNPDNQASLDALATQIATDYLAALNWVQDSIVLGISQWQETGYDDFIEFDAAYRDPKSGEYIAKTRIHTIPYNFVIENLFHYDSTTWEYGDKIVGTLNGNLSGGGTQTINVTRSDGPLPSGTTTLTVTNLHNITGTTGQLLTAVRCREIWLPIAKDCP